MRIDIPPATSTGALFEWAAATPMASKTAVAPREMSAGAHQFLRAHEEPRGDAAASTELSGAGGITCSAYSLGAAAGAGETTSAGGAATKGGAGVAAAGASSAKALEPGRTTARARMAAENERIV
jgi:hypothetical protein